MNNQYQHTQKGGFWFFFSIIVFTVVFMVLIYFTVSNQLRNSDWVGSLILPPLAIWVIALMSSLTVTIDDRYLRIAFGRWAFRKKYRLDDMANCRPIRNGWWWGWGIRWYFIGWLYNIDGLDAVEITFKDGKQIRIGTDEPDNLSQAVRKAIQSII